MVCYASAVTTTPQRDHVAVFGGSGDRSWTALQAALGKRPSGYAWAIPSAAVRRRITIALSTSPDTARRQADALLHDMQGALADGFAVAGFIGYDVGAALHGIAPAVPADGDPPCADLVVVDPGAFELVAAPTPTVRGDQAQHRPEPPAELAGWQQRYEHAVRQALVGIQRGSIYQVNLSVAVDLAAPDALVRTPLAHALGALLASQPVPYAMAMQSASGRLLSGSMERFLWTDGQIARSRPIKGTAARAASVDADVAVGQALRRNSKELAENTMIVDMVRNDLARVCDAGSVIVRALHETVAYHTLWHLESEVEGRLVRSATHADVLRALMPPASVTGCPKSSAMRWIRSLEMRRRGPYCGAIGVVLPSGAADWSVAIRTVWLGRGVARVSVGAGIVSASQPAAEFAEICAKARSSTAALAAWKDLTVGAA